MSGLKVSITSIVVAAGPSDLRPPTGSDNARPQAPEGGAVLGASMSDPSASGQAEAPHSQSLTPFFGHVSSDAYLGISEI